MPSSTLHPAPALSKPVRMPPSVQSSPTSPKKHLRLLRRNSDRKPKSPVRKIPTFKPTRDRAEELRGALFTAMKEHFYFEIPVGDFQQQLNQGRDADTRFGKEEMDAILYLLEGRNLIMYRQSMIHRI